jgi:hypothetical protein
MCELLARLEAEAGVMSVSAAGELLYKHHARQQGQQYCLGVCAAGQAGS